MRHSAALACRSPPRLSRYRFWVWPLLTGTGELPHRLANARSLLSRCGLSPAAISRVEAVSGPTPLQATSSGAVAVVIRASRITTRSSWSCRSWMRWASSRSARRVISRRLSSSRADPERRAGRDQLPAWQVAQVGAQLFRCGQHQGAQLVDRLGAGLVRAALHDFQGAQRLDRAVVGLRCRGGLAGEHRPGRGDRVDHIGLAVAAPDLPVRAGHLDHHDAATGAGGGPARPRSCRCLPPRPCRAAPKEDSQPQQLPVAGAGGREAWPCPSTPPTWSRAAATWMSRWVSTPPVTIGRVAVIVVMSVLLVRTGLGRARCGRRSDRTGTGLLAAGSY